MKRCRAEACVSIPAAVTFLVGGLGTFADTDAFNATSNFYGVDLGLGGEWKRGQWTLEWRGTVALGANFNNAAIGGRM